MISRRNFLAGTTAVLAAPVVARAAALLPALPARNLYLEVNYVTRGAFAPRLAETLIYGTPDRPMRFSGFTFRDIPIYFDGEEKPS